MNAEAPSLHVEEEPAHIDSLETVERERTLESLYEDPEMLTIVLRRHGQYERSMDSVQRGQLTKETMGVTRNVATDVVSHLPEDVDLRVITSPTEMPATGPTGDQIWPARARMTGAIYGSEIRSRYGEEVGARLERSELSSADITKNHAPKVRNNVIPDEIRGKLGESGTQVVRTTEGRLGDIFEHLDPSKGHAAKPFFDVLGKTYGGMNPKFWEDYIHGELPAELHQALVENGGDTAVEKASMALDWLQDMRGSAATDGKKHAAIAISHEEVIGSLMYQITQYLKETKTADPETLDFLEQAKFSYNEGMDIHIDSDSTAVVDVKGTHFALGLSDFKKYLDTKR